MYILFEIYQFWVPTRNWSAHENRRDMLLAVDKYYHMFVVVDGGIAVLKGKMRMQG